MLPVGGALVEAYKQDVLEAVTESYLGHEATTLTVGFLITMLQIRRTGYFAFPMQLKLLTLQQIIGFINRKLSYIKFVILIKK